MPQNTPDGLAAQETDEPSPHRFSSFVARSQQRAREHGDSAETDVTVAFGLLMRRVNKLTMLDAEIEILRPAELSWAAFRVCVSLWVDGPQQPAEIATSTSMSRAAISATMKALEKQGLISTAAMPEDLRGIVMSLTPAGLEMISRAHAEHLALTAQWLAPLSDPEKLLLQGLLGKIMMGPRSLVYDNGRAINS